MVVTGSKKTTAAVHTCKKQKHRNMVSSGERDVLIQHPENTPCDIQKSDVVNINLATIQCM